jgi:hypothetical protein
VAAAAAIPAAASTVGHLQAAGTRPAAESTARAEDSGHRASADEPKRGRIVPLPWLLGGSVAIAALLLLAVFPAMLRLTAARQPLAQRPHAAASAAPPAATAPAAAAPAAAPSAEPQDSAAPADSGASAPNSVLAQPAGAGSPTDAVGGFYSAVANHQFSAAASYWSANMQANWSPPVYIDQRFQPTQSMRLNSANVVSTDGDTATVSIDLIEVYSGSTRHWVGTWRLVRGPNGTWLLDAPNLRQA